MENPLSSFLNPAGGRTVKRARKTIPVAQKLAQRAEAIATIRLLLAGGPLTTTDISVKMGLHRTTVFAFMKFLWRDLRQVRRCGVFDGRRALWELGEDITLPTRPKAIEDILPVHRNMVPAMQLGVSPDPLVAAFFGRPPMTAEAQ